MPTTGLNHYLGAVLLLAAATSAAADVNDAIATCARIPSTGDRILCLEEALRRLDKGRTVPATGDSLADSDANRDMRAAPEALSPDEKAIATAPAQSREHVSAPAEDADATFGLPPARTDTQQRDSVLVTVTSVNRNAYGKLIFSTDSGQEWIQTDQASRRFREIPFQAAIREGASGGFFLRKASGGPSVRVRRRK